MIVKHISATYTSNVAGPVERRKISLLVITFLIYVLVDDTWDVHASKMINNINWKQLRRRLALYGFAVLGIELILEVFCTSQSTFTCHC